MAKSPRAQKAPTAKAAPAKSKSAPSRGAGKGAARAKAVPIARKAAAAPKAIRGGYPVICSECYSDFDYDPKVSAAQITCPVCMHVGAVAEREDQTRFQLAKSRERQKFIAGLLPGILFLGVGFVWLFLLNRAGSGEELGPGLHYGLLGATVILFIITVFQGVKYEAARYEVYF